MKYFAKLDDYQAWYFASVMYLSQYYSSDGFTLHSDLASKQMWQVEERKKRTLLFSLIFVSLPRARNNIESEQASEYERRRGADRRELDWVQTGAEVNGGAWHST